MSRSLSADYFIRDGFMVRRPRPTYEAAFPDFTARSTDLTELIRFRDHVEQQMLDVRVRSLREVQ